MFTNIGVTVLVLAVIAGSTTGHTGEDVVRALKSNRKFASLLRSNLARFHKHYSTSELPLRARNFRKNLVQVADCNAHATFNCDVNEFSTMTEAEKEQHLGLGNFTNMRDVPVDNSFRLMSVSSIDWREKNAVTPVKNQDACGSCWAFAATASVEGTYAITTGRLRTFSDQEILECTYEEATGYNGCGGGWMYDAFEYLKKHQHLSSQQDRPYEKKDGYCYALSVRNSAAAVEFTGYLKTKGEDRDLANAIAITPTTVAMLSRADFFSYSNGEYDGYYDCYGYTFPNHALTAVGFTQRVFIIKNSWGSEWGDGGYINVARYRNVCFINKFAYYATMKKIGEDTDPTDAPEPADKCADPKREDNCVDANERDCPSLRNSNRCFETAEMIYYASTNCRKSCGYCNNIPLSDIALDCPDLIKKNTCKDGVTQAACPKSCCNDGGDSDGDSDGDNDGCPGGNVRCPDGTCKHIHMC